MQMIRTVVDTEAPVHTSEITRRLLEAFGVTRAGSRIAAAVEGAINLGIRQNFFRIKGDFVYSLLRVCLSLFVIAPIWSQQNGNFEWVAPEEIDHALLKNSNSRLFNES